MAYVSCSGNPITQKLIAAGIIPLNCRRFTLEAHAGAALVVTSEVFVTEEQYRVLADALMRHREHIAGEVTAFSEQRIPHDNGVKVLDGEWAFAVALKPNG